LIRIIESSNCVAFPELVGDNLLDIGYGETVTSIEQLDNDLVVNTNRMAYRTKACLIADRTAMPDWTPPISVTPSGRVHIDIIPEHVEEQDVLVVGYTDHAIELAATLANAGASVVLAAGGMDVGRLAPAADNALRRLERERRATLLYRSVPDQIGEVKGFPMAFFDDRRTPDLQFDHVVFSSSRQTLTPQDVGLSEEALASGQVWFWVNQMSR
jgi:thioredoxin reductase